MRISSSIAPWIYGIACVSYSGNIQAAAGGRAGGPLDIVIVALGVLVVSWVLAATVKYFIHPKERSEDHVKRWILRHDW